jgi:IS5 family transposase
MLRLYLLQCWINLSDEGLEDTIYDGRDMSTFIGINFPLEQVPDGTSLLKLWYLLDKYNIGRFFFDAIAKTLETAEQIMRNGSTMVATLISAQSSTKKEKKDRDPEMHRTKKGNEGHVGMKCHIGVDAGNGYVHSLETTAANVHDITVAHNLIREEDELVYGDSGYIGMEKREEVQSSPRLPTEEYRIKRRHKSVRRMTDGYIDWEKQMKRSKSSVRSKVEHPFLIVIRYFGFAKTVYRGLTKITHRLYILFTSTNLLMCARACRQLMPA